MGETRDANPKRGSEIYRTLCARCHGDKLDGHGPEAQYLKVPPADLQSLSSRVKSDWELLIVLSHGVMFTPMHGYRDILTERDMKDVLSYIRMEAPFKPLT
jgi:mono/diheme cytochrome c family protein